MKSIRLSIAHRMRHLKLSGDVVARAKRMSSIRGKLRRNPGKLDQMQDLGGCRAIMDDISGVNALVTECQRMPHEVRNHKNYVDQAKSDGYRSHHVIFRFDGDADRAMYRGRRVELQIRTKLQHSWATAVEVVGQTRLEELKSGKGSAEWLRFFRLMSDEFSFEEGCELDSVASGRRQRLDEIRDCNNTLRAIDVLENHRSTMRYISFYILSGDARVFLIRYDNVNHTVSVEGYSDPSVGAPALQHEEMAMEESGLAESLSAYADCPVEMGCSSDRLGRISKQGDPYLRRLLVVGAHAVLRFSRKAKVAPTRWAAELLMKKPYNVVAVALANMMARIVWALTTTGRRFEATASL